MLDFFFMKYSNRPVEIKTHNNQKDLHCKLKTEYVNLEKSKSAATVQLANGNEVCILYYTFDLMEAPKKKGI